MNSVIALAPFFVVAALMGAIAIWIVSAQRKAPDSPVDDAVWGQALGANPSVLNRLVLGAAKPLSKLPPIFEAGASRQYASLASLVGASGKWGGSLEVFLSVQALALLVGLTGLSFAWAAHLRGLALALVVVGGLVVAAYPFVKTREAASKRAEAISNNLPDFAEVLLMNLTAGQSVMQALRFTASTPDVAGPVTTEVISMLALMDLRELSDKELFDVVGHRLGTAESVAFFNALSKAHIDGSKVVEAIQAQAAALRNSQFQKARAKTKKLPTKLMLITFIHLMLSLFVVAFLPFIITIQSVT